MVREESSRFCIPRQSPIVWTLKFETRVPPAGRVQKSTPHEIKGVLLGFPTRLSRSALQKRNACILGRIRRHPLKCQKESPTPYARPSFIRHESEAEYPEWARSIVKTLRQELEAPQFEVKPQYVTAVDSDRRYVEVPDSFCQLVGYQRGCLSNSCQGPCRRAWHKRGPGRGGPARPPKKSTDVYPAECVAAAQSFVPSYHEFRCRTRRLA